jgi:hypothetical protein
MQAHMTYINGDAAEMCEDPRRARRNPKADEQFD